MKNKILTKLTSLFVFLMYISLCHCDSASGNSSNKTQSLENNDVKDCEAAVQKIILNPLYFLIDKQIKLANDSYTLLQNKMVNESYSILQSNSIKLTECESEAAANKKSNKLITLLQNFTRCCDRVHNSSINIYNEFYSNRLIRISIFSLVFLIFQFIIIIILIILTVCNYRNNFNLLKK